MKTSSTISFIAPSLLCAFTIVGPQASAIGSFRGSSAQPKMHASFQAQQQKMAILQASPIYTLRVHAIRFSNNDGTETTPITPQQVKEWIDKANDIFYISSAGIQLQFDPNPNGPDWETRKNTKLNRLSSLDQSTWKEANEIAAAHPGKFLFLFRFSGSDGNKGNGFAFPPQSQMVTNFVALPGFDNTAISTGTPSGPWVQNIWQLAHETGHHLGLAHTFPGWSDNLTDTAAKAAEYIKTNGGTEAALDGDSIADTPPEAGASFYKNQGWNYCAGHDSYTINGTGVKPFSYTFTPNRHNVMSYFACETMKFTKDQVARMRQTLQLPVRKHLIAPMIKAKTAELADFGFGSI